MDKLNLSSKALRRKSKDELVALVQTLAGKRPQSPVSARETDIDDMESLRDFRRLFDESILPMSMVDCDGIIRRVNTAYCALTGFSEGEVIGHSVDEFTHVDDHPELTRLRQGLKGTAELPELVDKKILHKSGATLYCRFKRLPIRDDTGALRFLVAQLIDLTDQRRQSRELGHQRTLFEAVFWNMPVGLAFMHPDRTIRMCNTAYAELFGYTEGELEGQSAAILYADPNEFERQGRLRYNEDAEERFDPFVIDFRRKDGSVFSGESVGTVIRDESGEVLGYMGMVRDITERDRAERALRESEHRFRDFTVAAADRFWETDAEGRYVYLSPNSETFPVPEEKLIGELQWHADSFSADADELHTFRERIVRREPFRDFRYRITDQYGGPRYRRSSGVPVFDEQNRFKGYRGVSIDETGEVLARNEAETLAARFRAAIENFNAGFALWDADRRFVACNEFFRQYTSAAEEILAPGARYEDFLRWRAHEIAAYRDIDIEGWIAARLSDFDSPTSGHEFEDPDGSWYRITKQRLPDGGNLFFLADITETKRREEALVEATAHAESASRAKSEFLSNVSHELRTPLNAILGFAQMFERAPESMTSDKLIRFGGIIRENGTYLLNLINGILDLSAIEAGRLTLNEDDIALADLAEAALHIVQLRAGEERIELTNRILTDAPRINVDPIKMKQVLVNLLANAIKFTTSGGRVELDYSAHRGEPLSIVVRDTGIGMTQAEIAVALEKFGRVEGSRRTAREGIGLGLPLVKELVEAHGGTLRLESAPNVGTTVTVTLPETRIVA